MKILIAEDETSSALILRRTLERIGHEVTTASDGAEAWERFQQETFPLVISDWMMPRMDGPALCRKIRARQDGGPYTHLMLLTSRGDQQDRLEGLSSGADDFLEKPLGRGELFARLEIAQRILKMQDEMRQLNARLGQQNEQLEATVFWLEFANHRFSELFAGLPTACCSCGEDGRIYEWNRAAQELFGYSPDEVQQQPVWDVFGEEDPARQRRNAHRQRAAIRRVLAGKALTGIEVTVRRRDGKRLHLLSSAIPLRGADGRITGVISAHVDITERRALEGQVAAQLQEMTVINATLNRQKQELEAANLRLEELATTDSLTGLKNHRFLQEALHANLGFARRKRLPVSVILMDVDDFKSYNDALGHPAGDEVLRQISALLRQGVRSHDLAGRYGGEEFMALLPATAAEEAMVVAERLRSAIESFAWPERPMTASFGIATFDPNVQAGEAVSPGRLIQDADRALYRSKAEGRNRVMSAGALPLSPQSTLSLAA